jgi:putative toxin-antitoxin system antitoxin component (TIGR02293 family)
MPTAAQGVRSRLDRETAAFFKAIASGEVRSSGAKSVTYDRFLEDRMLIISAIRAGIPYTLFNLIRALTPFTEKDWAEFLNVSTKSLQRYGASIRHRFKPIHSEKIIEMAEVTKLGLDVFGDMEKLRLWLETPSFALGGMKPIDLLMDSYGKELVVGELTRINHGILV